MYKAYLISLTNPDEKIKYLKEKGVYPILVKGVNGKELNENDKELRNISNLYKKFGPKSAIGCALSHLNTWKNFLENTSDKYAIIFEDDIILVDDFVKKLDIVMSYVPKDFDVLYIGCMGCDQTIQNKINIFIFLASLIGLTSEYKKINKYISIPSVAFATHSYILSRKGAQKLIEYLEGNINNHIDFCMQQLASKNKIKTYVSTPRLAYQTSTNDIASENISSNHPLIITKLLNNIYIDEMVKANYLSSVSLARLKNINVNFFSILFLIIGIIFSFMKVSIKNATIFYLVISILDILKLKNTNDLKILIFHYLLLVIPIILFYNLYNNKYEKNTR
jgi:GR25 family glycosyltransferase involved in LPS biosynthesis